MKEILIVIEKGIAVPLEFWMWADGWKHLMEVQTLERIQIGDMCLHPLSKNRILVTPDRERLLSWNRQGGKAVLYQGGEIDPEQWNGIRMETSADFINAMKKAAHLYD